MSAHVLQEWHFQHSCDSGLLSRPPLSLPPWDRQGEDPLEDRDPKLTFLGFLDSILARSCSIPPRKTLSSTMAPGQELDLLLWGLTGHYCR